MAKQSSALAELINTLPDPDERGLLSNIDKETVDSVVSQIYEGGRKSLLALIGMLVEPGRGDDVKPRYALHCLAVHMCKPDEEKSRRVFTRTLAMQLGGDKPKAVQKYLIRQLQVVGGKEVVPALGIMLEDEELYEPAAQALVAIGNGAAEQLRNALPKVDGKMKLMIIQNLGVVRDAESAGALKKALGDDDREIRLAAGWALANIGDAGSVDLLLKAANAGGTYERVTATKACLLLAERLLEAGKKEPAEKIYMHLRDTRSGPDESYIRAAAEKGLTSANKR
ncbi:MAG: HEAT repeat domain-containing protein [Sedimentisphaerales bacterium]